MVFNRRVPNIGAHCISLDNEYGSYLVTRHPLTREVLITAMAAGNDDMVLSAMTILRARGIAIPQAISLVGHDNEACVRHVMPALTTVHAPLDEMAQEAAEWFLNLVTGASLPVSTPFMPALVERETAFLIISALVSGSRRHRRRRPPGALV